MKLTKLGHACVRLTKDDRTLVIDPGGLTPEQDALEGADAVLITHEHFDHFDENRLRQAMAANPRLELYASHVVADKLADLGGRVRAAGHGDALTIAGFDVHVYGEDHEILDPDVPPIPNTGFLVDGEVFHPGDALTVPSEPVPTLCLPGTAPWMKVSEMYSYVKEVAPERAYVIHDGILNEVGISVMETHVGNAAAKAGKEYRRLKPGESVSLP
ncbi:L-ascorbate metabolism protein UlaG, beta-lactamase superfamily [Thermomonospora echinospora]|uniref:L-ascorbate metabolism protein UlaG, beta-lactamase superfamily n=1 Tax=Thermomonospora echinospora TaxID=1992 RepID=A0A1H5W268_9ACTN|nr:MBL fold metallo-hydrolase [Thermomonospora echinospora]SEF93550.1 L-ascorbate metabolism protein UlaG, beta-lactamase superfamily [Thermomonospora echinospora]